MKMCGTRKVKHKRVKLVMSIAVGTLLILPRSHILRNEIYEYSSKIFTGFLKTGGHHNYKLEIVCVNSRVQPLWDIMLKSQVLSFLKFYVFYLYYL